MDVLIASLVIIVTSPLLIATVLAVRATSAGSALFKQTRIGLGGEPFIMLKFRTMYADSDDAEHRSFNLRDLQGEAPSTSDGVFKLEGDPRITRVGKYLRRFSIDELPQMFNVLRGDMSLVGPRPSLPWEAAIYSERQRRRHQCRPGITGLWQVSGRNRLSMPEMIELDLIHVERCSLGLDLMILVRTPRSVLFEDSVR
jgi:lipopolysaccharide/colanic/teichoic acid biosynthesis glycosyltransferase